MDEPTLIQWQQGAIDYAARAIDMEKIKGQYREMFSLQLFPTTF